MGEARIRILVAERNQLLGEALGAVFSDMNRAIDISVAAGLASALDMTRRTAPDLVLMDAWLGRVSVEDTMRQIKECSPRSRIVVTSSHPDADLRRRVLKAGAMDHVVKDMVPVTAIDIIEAVVAGG